MSKERKQIKNDEEKSEEEKKEYLIKLNLLQQQAEKIGQENENVTKQVIELQELKENLQDFLASKGKDSLISLGKGIYTKAELKEKELYVNIGANIVVKKRVPETVELIDEQIKKLEEVKESFGKELGLLNMQLNHLLENIKQ